MGNFLLDLFIDISALPYDFYGWVFVIPDFILDLMFLIYSRSKSSFTSSFTFIFTSNPFIWSIGVVIFFYCVRSGSRSTEVSWSPSSLQPQTSLWVLLVLSPSIHSSVFLFWRIKRSSRLHLDGCWINLRPGDYGRHDSVGYHVFHCSSITIHLVFWQEESVFHTSISPSVQRRERQRSAYADLNS